MTEDSKEVNFTLYSYRSIKRFIRGLCKFALWYSATILKYVFATEILNSVLLW